jgi:hypothetical protein
MFFIGQTNIHMYAECTSRVKEGDSSRKDRNPYRRRIPPIMERQYPNLR